MHTSCMSLTIWLANKTMLGKALTCVYLPAGFSLVGGSHRDALADILLANTSSMQECADTHTTVKNSQITSTQCHRCMQLKDTFPFFAVFHCDF